MKKVAIVTGATDDIGRTIVERFIKDDVFTIGWDIDSESLGQNSSDLDEKSYRSISVNSLDMASIESAVKESMILK